MFSKSFTKPSLFLSAFGSALVLCATVAMTGCAVTNVLPSDTATDDVSGGAISGNVHGGQQPIYGATVTLYVVGLTGYGSTGQTVYQTSPNGTLVASTTSDQNGNFSLPTYNCPTAVSPATAADLLVYLVATGGYPAGSGGSSNSAISLMTVLAGPGVHGTLASLDTCSNIKTNAATTTVQMNEQTTVAAMYALAQFYNPSTGSIGTDSTNFQGLINAFNIAAELVNPVTGAPASFQPTGTLSSNSYMNDIGTPDSDKIALIADIIAACVNSTGPTSPSCSTLFQYAVPPPTPATTTLGSSFSFPAAAGNTMTAAYYMAVNPINATAAGSTNATAINKLYNMAGTNPAFAFTESQPTDWTISVVYSSSVYGGATDGVISAPTNLAADANGNVVYLTSSTTTNGQAVASLNPYGGVEAFAISADPLQGFIFDGSNYGYTSRLVMGTPETYSLTGGISTKDIDEIEDANDSNLIFQAGQFASDGVNVFITTGTGQSDSGSIFQVPGQGQTIGGTASPFTSGTATMSTASALNAGHLISGLTTSSPIVADSVSHIYTVAGSSVYQTAYNKASIPSGASGATPASIGSGLQAPAALAVDNSNNVWIANAAGGSPADGYISYYNPTTTTLTSDSTDKDGGVNNPEGIAIDGRGNVWVASAGQGPSFTGQTVSEFALINGTLTPLSPSVGFAHSYAQPSSIAVDLSGNVWVANSGVFANVGYSATLTYYQITSSDLIFFTSAANPFLVGQTVTISGTGIPSFDGKSFVIATIYSSTEFEIADTAGPVTAKTPIAGMASEPTTAGSITCIVGAASPVVTPIAKGIGASPATQGSLP